MGFTNPVQPDTSLTLSPDTTTELVTGASGSQYWPCRAGEANAPVLTNGAAYVPLGPQPAIRVLTTAGAGDSKATWPAVSRYSAYGTTRPLVMRLQVYIPTGAADYNAYIGFGTDTGMQISSAGPDSSTPLVPIWARAVGHPGSSITPRSLGPKVTIANVDPTLGWVDFELAFSLDQVRLTVAGDTTNGRSTAVATSDANLQDQWAVVQPEAGHVSCYLSNLLMTFPANMPA